MLFNRARDLDERIDYHNHELAHQAKMRSGKTPMQTLRNEQRSWKEKNLN